MNLLRHVLEILGFGTATSKGKKVRPSLRQRAYRQARARQLLFEQVEDRRVLATVSAQAMTPTVTEGNGAAVYFNVSPTSSSPITVYYQTVAGSATENTDYQGVTGSATIGPGQNFASVSVNTFTDSLAESAETFSVTITSVSGATLGTPSAGITINNVSGGGSGVVSVAAGSSHVSEGSAATFTLTLSPPQASAVTVSYQTAAGSAIENTDYEGKTGTATIPAGQSSATVSVPTFHDFQTDPSETFSLQITAASDASVSPTQNSATTTIDDVAFVLPTIAITGGSLGPNGSFTPLIDVDTGTADSSYTYTINWGDGSEATYGTSDTPSHTYFDEDPAVTPADIYTLSVTAAWLLGPSATASGVMTINTAGGWTSGPYSIPTSGPINAESDYAGYVQFNYPPGPSPPPGPGELPIATVSASKSVVIEGLVSHRVVAVTAMLDRPAPAGGTVVLLEQFAVSGQDNADNNDWFRTSGPSGTANLGNSLQISIGHGYTTETMYLAIVDDNLTEPFEFLNLRILPSGVRLGTPSVASLMIVDNDQPVGGGATPTGTVPPSPPPPPNGPVPPGTLPSVSIMATKNAYEILSGTIALPPGFGRGEFRILRTGPTDSALTVYYTVGGSATNGTDYAQIPTSYVIPAGKNYVDIVVNPVNDRKVEGTETVALALNQHPTYLFGASGGGQLPIFDNDFWKWRESNAEQVDLTLEVPPEEADLYWDPRTAYFSAVGRAESTSVNTVTAVLSARLSTVLYGVQVDENTVATPKLQIGFGFSAVSGRIHDSYSAAEVKSKDGALEGFIGHKIEVQDTDDLERLATVEITLLAGCGGTITTSIEPNVGAGGTVKGGVTGKWGSAVPAGKQYQPSHKYEFYLDNIEVNADEMIIGVFGG